jgi:hypothetical protein
MSRDGNIFEQSYNLKDKPENNRMFMVKGLQFSLFPVKELSEKKTNEISPHL